MTVILPHNDDSSSSSSSIVSSAALEPDRLWYYLHETDRHTYINLCGYRFKHLRHYTAYHIMLIVVHTFVILTAFFSATLIFLSQFHEQLAVVGINNAILQPMIPESFTTDSTTTNNNNNNNTNIIFNNNNEPIISTDHTTQDFSSIKSNTDPLLMPITPGLMIDSTVDNNVKDNKEPQLNILSPTETATHFITTPLLTRLTQDFHFIFTMGMIAIDIYYTYLYYHKRTYAPFNIASSLLFLKKGIVILPNAPSTIYLLDKIFLLCQGYLFVIVPWLNIKTLLLNPEYSAQLQKMSWITEHVAYRWALEIELIFYYVILIQLVLTLYTWLMFSLFYTIFIYEVLFRVFFGMCCVMRKRQYYDYDRNGEIIPLLIRNDPQYQYSDGDQQQHQHNNSTILQQPNLNRVSTQTLLVLSHEDICNNNNNLQQQQQQQTQPLINTSTPYGAINDIDQQHDTTLEIDQLEAFPTLPYRTGTTHHILASHISDPIFYKPYQFFWVFI